MVERLDVDRLVAEFKKPFESRPFYSPQDGSIQWCFENADCFAERVDNWLTVYKAFDDQRMVGFKLKNVKALLSVFDKLGLQAVVSKRAWQITVNLRQILAYSPWALPDGSTRPAYAELLPRIPADELVDLVPA